MRSEPVIGAAAVQAAIVAAINMAVSFGWVSVSGDQMAAVNGFLAVVLPLVFAVFVRSRVSPVATVDKGQ